MAAYFWNATLSHVAKKLSELTDVEVSADDLVAPPDLKLGDVAFGCFKLSKVLGKSPVEIATFVEGKMSGDDELIESMKAAGPYVNVTLKAGVIVPRIVQDVMKMKNGFGEGEEGAGKSLLLEYAQPNTHKEIHIGHLRNLLIGSSLDRVLSAADWKVVPVSYHGDVGAHVAKCLWYLVRSKASEAFESLDDAKAEEILSSVPREERNGKYLGGLYSASTKALEEDPDLKAQVSAVQQKLEANAPGWSTLWKETRQWSVDEMVEIFKGLGVKLDRQYFESEVVEEGQKMVDILLKKGIARESQGAVIVDLEEEKLGVFVVRKSDGTSLYATKDLALAVKKAEDFPAVTRSLHVVDVRQEFYFKQLFRVLGLMGYRMPLEYVGYEIVTLTTGAMSSREGNVVTWEGFRDEVMAYATAETKKRHEDWSDERVSQTAQCLAMGGIKFSMLKQDSDKIFTFDLARSLSFDGDTGPYIQYAATRLAAILKKAEWKATSAIVGIDTNTLVEPSEKHVALHIAAFPAACRKAAEELRPSIIAQWCVTMASRINDFYRDVNVLGSEGELREMRLQLVSASHTVLEKALEMLGIQLPDEM